MFVLLSMQVKIQTIKQAGIFSMGRLGICPKRLILKKAKNNIFLVCLSLTANSYVLNIWSVLNISAV